MSIMHKKISLYSFAILYSIFFLACGNQAESQEASQVDVGMENYPMISVEYEGNYNGIQASYTMKNQYGDDMIIGGQKITIPAIDFKFLLKVDGAAGLQQTNLDDNSRVYYKGTLKVLNEDANSLTVECSLSDGKSSNPTYTLEINKADKSAVCKGANEPEFSLTKQN
jgi:hypothetical protein